MHGNKPRFSICIPSRNRRVTLRHAISSALAQTFSDFEVIVMDNASDPSAESLVRGFGDRRIKYFRNPMGVGSRENWETALSKASGDYTLLLADDDALVPTALEIVNDVIAGQPRAFVQAAHVRYTHPLGDSGVTTLENRLQSKAYSGALVSVDAEAVCRAIFNAWAIGRDRSPVQLPTDPHPSACYMATPAVREIRNTFGSLTVAPFGDVGFISAMIRSSEVWFLDTPLTVVGVDLSREINGPLPGRRRYYDSLAGESNPTGIRAVTFTNLATSSHLEILNRHHAELREYAAELRNGFYVNHLLEILQDPVHDRRWWRDLTEAMLVIRQLSAVRWPGIVLGLSRFIGRGVVSGISRRLGQRHGTGSGDSPARNWIPGQSLGFADIQGCAVYVASRIAAAESANSSGIRLSDSSS